MQWQMQRAQRGLSAYQNDSQSVRVGLCVDVHCDVSGIPVVPACGTHSSRPFRVAATHFPVLEEKAPT